MRKSAEQKIPSTILVQESTLTPGLYSWGLHICLVNWRVLIYAYQKSKLAGIRILLLGFFSAAQYVPLIHTAARPQQDWMVLLMCMLIKQHYSRAIILVKQPAFYRVQRDKGNTRGITKWKGDYMDMSVYVRNLIFPLVNRFIVLPQSRNSGESNLEYSILLFNGGKEVRHDNLAMWIVNLPRALYEY